ncbi:hypothetical protein KI809_19805 [Geobacter pelophilus]|uniref:Membrane protein YfhO n=1 Tax=Geoanaerobacter pelophilus TaxID=60036 RepID=A0AAW4LDP5_9BACT|nr:hypothetical protein [Geoanaerobacter pelophilus]MBT0666561.1 hypothetical protein [Geoanaerobacter pelophilus]
MLKAIPDYRYPVALLLLTLVAFFSIEISHPYYFMQDDNRVLYLPIYLHNLRSVLSGEFPFYNFHQYLGTPVTIHYAALYPIYYLALLLSNFMFGHYFASFEIIALFHLILAAQGFYFFGRYFELDDASCLFGGITWAFCSFVIIGGNSWIHVTGLAAYLPWILLYTVRQCYSFDLRAFLLLLFFKVCNLLLGYPQYFLYTATFEILTVILFCLLDSKSTKFTKALVSFTVNYFLVVIVTLPIILQTAWQTKVSAYRSNPLSWNEYVGYSYNLKYWLSGLIDPFSSTSVITQFELHYLSFVGYLTILFFFLYLYKRKVLSGKCAVLGTVSIILFLFAIMWAGELIVTRLFYYVPVYNRMRYPFKLAIFGSFFITVISILGFDIFLKQLSDYASLTNKTVKVVAATVIVVHLCIFIAVYSFSPQRTFGYHEDPLPLTEPLKATIADGRIISASLDDVIRGDKLIPGFSAPYLGYDYATLWGLFHFGGYDPLVSQKGGKASLGIKNNPVFNLPADEPFYIPQETLEHFRKWGVKWYVVNKAIPLDPAAPFQLQYSDTYRNVLKDSLARPMVYWQEAVDNARLSYRFKTNSVEIDSDCNKAGTVIVNMLYHPYFTAQVDGIQIEVAETADNQMSLSVPKGRHSIALRYADRSFINGAKISGAVILLIILSLSFAKIRARLVNLFLY